MNPPLKPQGTAPVTTDRASHRSRIMWLILGVYVVGFVLYAGFDLYAEHTTQGLFNVHRTPFMHALGNVVDPKPNQTINHEISARLKVSASNLPSDWFEDTQRETRIVRERSIRMPNTNEILLGELKEGGELLVLGQYRGEWVTFRPFLGVIIESVDPLLSLDTGLILETPAP